MNLLNPLLPYIIFNKLYKLHFSLYKYLYFKYKFIKDKEEIELIKHVVKPGMVVLDIGANIGFYTLILSNLVGEQGEVHAFEPENKNFKHLSTLCKFKNNIILNNTAVGEKNGTINLYISEQLNIDHQTYYNKEEKRKIIKVKSLSIDQYFSKNNKIDFIKIDTQGFEYQVLLGMKNVIKRSKKIMLLCEYSPYDFQKAGNSSVIFLKLLRNLKFKIDYVEKDYKKRLSISILNRMSYVNIIATKGY